MKKPARSQKVEQPETQVLVREKRLKLIPLRILLPNMVTLLALCSGLTSIRLAMEGRFEMAVYAILFAAILDGIDGRLARILKSATRFGAELDSLSDFVNFGVAPAVVIYLWGLSSLKSVGWAVVLIYAIAAALRLARFNVMSEEPHDDAPWKKGYFSGVPSPAGAVLCLVPLYLDFLDFDLSVYKFALAFYVLLIAGLMVSALPTYSGKTLGARVQRKYVIFILFAVAVFAIGFVNHTWQVLLLICFAYFVSMYFSYKSYSKMNIAT